MIYITIYMVIPYITIYNSIKELLLISTATWMGLKKDNDQEKPTENILHYTAHLI